MGDWLFGWVHDLLNILQKSICYILDFIKEIFCKLAGIETVSIGGKQEDLLSHFLLSDGVKNAFLGVFLIGVILLFVFVTENEQKGAKWFSSALDLTGKETGVKSKYVLVDGLPKGTDAFQDGDVTYIDRKIFADTVEDGKVTETAEQKMAWAFAHETGHFSEDTKEYTVLTTVLDEVGIKKEVIEEMRTQSQADSAKTVADEYGISKDILDAIAENKDTSKFNQNDVKLALSEIRAKEIELALGNKETIDRLVAEDRSVAKKILNRIKDAIKKIELFVKGDKESITALTNLRTVEKLFSDALSASGQQYLRGKASSRGIDTNDEMPYSKRGYNEFNTLAMQWAHSDKTQVGEQNAFYRKGKFVKIEKTSEGYIEVKSVSSNLYKEISDEVKNNNARKNENIYKNFDEYESVPGSSDLYRYGDRPESGSNGQNGGVYQEESGSNGVDASQKSGRDSAVKIKENGVAQKSIRGKAWDALDITEQIDYIISRNYHFKDSVISDEEQRSKIELLNQLPQFAQNNFIESPMFRDLSYSDMQIFARIYNGETFSYDELMSLDVVKKSEEYNFKAQLVLQKHTDPTPEQGIYFEKINSEFLKDIKNYSAERKAFIIVGLPSSGKSSAIASELLKKHNAFEFDNDTIKSLMTEPFAVGKGANACQDASSWIADNLALPQVTKAGYNLVIPIVGKSSEAIISKYEALTKNGYKTIELYEVDLPKRLALNRAATRFLEKGRYVSLTYINGIETEKIKEAFEHSKTLEGVTYYDRFDNDVPRGEKAISERETQNARLLDRGAESGSLSNNRRGGEEQRRYAGNGVSSQRQESGSYDGSPLGNSGLNPETLEGVTYYDRFDNDVPRGEKAISERETQKNRVLQGEQRGSGVYIDDRGRGDGRDAGTGLSFGKRESGLHGSVSNGDLRIDKPIQHSKRGVRHNEFLKTLNGLQLDFYGRAYAKIDNPSKFFDGDERAARLAAQITQMSTMDESIKTKYADDLATDVIRNIVVTDIDSNYLEELTRDAKAVNYYRKKLNLASIAAEIKSKYDKGTSQGIMLQFQAPRGTSAIGVDIAARELRSQGVKINLEQNEADIFFEMLDVLENARTASEKVLSK